MYYYNNRNKFICANNFRIQTRIKILVLGIHMMGSQRFVKTKD